MTQHEELIDLLRRMDERLERIEKLALAPLVVSEGAGLPPACAPGRVTYFHPDPAGAMRPEGSR